MKNYASCVFGDVGGAHPPYVVFVVPFLFCSRVKLNQLSPLVLLIQISSFNNPSFVGSWFYFEVLISPLSREAGKP